MRAENKYDRPIVAVMFLKAACDIMLWKTSLKEGGGGPDGDLCLQWGNHVFQAALSSREGFLLGKGWAYRLLLVLSRLWKYG